MQKQTSVWTRLARFLASILAALFVVTLPPALLLRTAASVAFQPEVVQVSLNRRLLESGALRSFLVKQILPDPNSPAQDDEEGLDFLVANLDARDWEEISRIAIPDEWIAQQFSQLLDELYAWLDSDELAPRLEINAEPVKRRLLGQGTERILEIIIESWPECSSEQIAIIESEFRSEGGIPLLGCTPPEPFRTVTLELAADGFQAEARQIPSRIPLIDDVGGGAADLLEAKMALLQARLLARWGIIVPAALLGLIMALAVRSWRGWARWWGVPLLLGGGLTLILALLAGTYRDQLLGRLLRDWPPVPQVAAILRSVALDLTSAVLRRWALLGALAGGVGSMLNLVTAVIKAPRQQPGGDQREAEPEDEDEVADSGMFT